MWCSTVQSCLKEQRLLGHPRPPQPPRPLRTGMLELRGHKAKVFAALSPGELALYKSEQVRRAGLGPRGLTYSPFWPHCACPDPARPSLWALGSASLNCKAAASGRPRVAASTCSHHIAASGGAQTGRRQGSGRDIGGGTGVQRTRDLLSRIQWVCTDRRPVNRVKDVRKVWAGPHVARGMEQVGRYVHAHGLAVHPSASQPSLGGLGRAGRPLCRKQ